jgi:hypothetical protein
MTTLCRFILVSSLGAISFAGAAHAESHIFTTTDGRFLRGELVSSNGEQTVLKTTDGQVQTVAFRELIGSDQDYITLRSKTVDPEQHQNFEVSWTKEKTGSRVEGVNHTKVTKNSFITHIKVRNLSKQASEDLDLHYQLYYNNVEGTKTVLKHIDGVVKMPALQAGATTTLDSKSFELDSSELAAGRYYVSGAPSRQIDSFKGVVVTFKHKNQPVFEYVTPGLTKAP